MTWGLTFVIVCLTISETNLNTTHSVIKYTTSFIRYRTGLQETMTKHSKIRHGSERLKQQWHGLQGFAPDPVLLCYDCWLSVFVRPLNSRSQCVSNSLACSWESFFYWVVFKFNNCFQVDSSDHWYINVLSVFLKHFIWQLKFLMTKFFVRYLENCSGNNTVYL